MKMFRKTLATLLTATLLLTACSQNAGPSPSSEAPADAGSSKVLNLESSNGAATTEPIPISFWYSLGGKSGEAVLQLAENFNKSQSKYVLTAEYQGNYTDSLLKFISSPADQRPDVIMVNELGTQKIMDTGDYFPAQQFIDSGILDITGYQQNVMNAYKNAEGMFAFPFSITVPGITYNIEVLEKAGVNPETDLSTFEDFNEACKKIVASGAAKYGACIVNDSWHVEQMVSMLGSYLTDADNGRSGRVTKLTAAEDGSLLKVLRTLRDFYVQPYAYIEANAGEARSEFCSQNVGMIITTVGNYGVMKDTAGGLFTLGQAPMPAFEGSTGVPYPSGAALWIVDRGQDEKAVGVVEFVKFFATVEQQAEFILATGYLPINDDVLANPDYKNFVDNENPGVKKILEQVSKATRGGGAIFAVDDQFRSITAAAVNRMQIEKDYTPEQAVVEIEKQTNEAISLYNRTLK